MTPLIVTLLLATLAGLALRRRDGRFARTPDDPEPARLHPELAPVGAVATLVQISAEACAVCPRVATVLRAVADETPGVAHFEIRAEDHPGLLERLDVRRSPTVLLIDHAGRLRGRASGAVTAGQAREVLAGLGEVSDVAVA